MYFPSGYSLWTQRTTCCLKSSWKTSALTHSPVKTGYQRPRSTRPATHSPRMPSFCPLAIASVPCHRLITFSHWKSYQWYCWDPRKSWYVAVPCRALSNDSAARDLHGDRVPNYPRLTCTQLVGLLPGGFCSSCPSQPPNGGRPTKCSWLDAPLCICVCVCVMDSIMDRKTLSLCSSGCSCRRKGWSRCRCGWMRTRRANHKSMRQSFGIWGLSPKSRVFLPIRIYIFINHTYNEQCAHNLLQ